MLMFYFAYHQKQDIFKYLLEIMYSYYNLYNALISVSFNAFRETVRFQQNLLSVA